MVQAGRRRRLWLVSHGILILSLFFSRAIWKATMSTCSTMANEVATQYWTPHQSSFSFISIIFDILCWLYVETANNISSNMLDTFKFELLIISGLRFGIVVRYTHVIAFRYSKFIWAAWIDPIPEAIQNGELLTGMEKKTKLDAKHVWWLCHLCCRPVTSLRMKMLPGIHLAHIDDTHTQVIKSSILFCLLIGHERVCLSYYIRPEWTRTERGKEQ